MKRHREVAHEARFPEVLVQGGQDRLNGLLRTAEAESDDDYYEQEREGYALNNILF